jgi:hypothetical protein
VPPMSIASVTGPSIGVSLWRFVGMSIRSSGLAAVA